MTKDSLNSTLKMQGYALFLMGEFPPTLKKRMLFEMLKELEIQLPRDELETLERFYTPPQRGKLVVRGPGGGQTVPRPKLRLPIFCGFCSNKAEYKPDSGMICLSCDKLTSDCTCAEPVYLDEGDRS